MDSSACGHVHQYIIKLRYSYVAAIIHAMPSMVPRHTTHSPSGHGSLELKEISSLLVPVCNLANHHHDIQAFSYIHTYTHVYIYYFQWKSQHGRRLWRTVQKPHQTDCSGSSTPLVVIPERISDQIRFVQQTE